MLRLLDPPKAGEPLSGDKVDNALNAHTVSTSTT